MFSLMACCFKWIKERREPRKQVTLAIIGLDNAGKTTALKGVQGESLDLVAPTVGFASTEFKFGKYDVTVFDLGGGKGIRDIWSNYYSEAHGVIFVLDASAEDRLQECKECLEGVLKKDRIQGKRILLLANKQDQEGALDEIDICDHLDLEDIVNNSKCPCRVETCSAVQGIGKKIDPAIRDGVQWLLDGIADDWPTISKRVEDDSKEQQEEEARARKAKRERILKEKEERQKREEEERKAQGLPEQEVDSDEGDVMEGANPFQKVDGGYFAKKKQEAAQAKEKKKKAKEEDDKRSNKSKEEIVMSETANKSNVNSNHSRTKEGSDNEDRSGGDNERTNTDSGLVSPDVLSQGEQSAKEENGTSLVVGSRENLVDAQEPLETAVTGGEEKKKKKKKKGRKNNKTAPMPVEGIDEVTPPALPTPLATPSWAQAPGHRNLFRASQKPMLAPLVEHNSPRQPLDALAPTSTANNNHKLPQLRPISTKPNLEDDDDVMT